MTFPSTSRYKAVANMTGFYFTNIYSNLPFYDELKSMKRSHKGNKVSQLIQNFSEHLHCGHKISHNKISNGRVLPFELLNSCSRKILAVPFGCTQITDRRIRTRYTHYIVDEYLIGNTKIGYQ